MKHALLVSRAAILLEIWGILLHPKKLKREAITVGGGHIMDPTASRTMLSIIRQHWLVGCFTYCQANINTKGKFPETVLKEFHRYYIYEDGISDSQGNKDVLTYVDNRMRGMKTEVGAIQVNFRRAISNIRRARGETY